VIGGNVTHGLSTFNDKVDAPIIDYLSNFGADFVEYEVVDIFSM
jgi:hypothetical protein